MYLVSSGFSFKPTSSSSSSSLTQFNQELVCRKVVVKHSIKSNQNLTNCTVCTNSGAYYCQNDMYLHVLRYYSCNTIDNAIYDDISDILYSTFISHGCQYPTPLNLVQSPMLILVGKLIKFFIILHYIK